MSVSQGQKIAHKLMRRGTRACRECRRRKIKCIYNEDKDEICQECATHARTCIPQGKIRGGSSTQSSRSVKIQVARLESAVQKLAREKAIIHEDAVDDARKPSTAAVQAIDLAFLEQQLKKRSPVFSLFDNDAIKQNGVYEAYGNELKSLLAFANPDMSDRDKLLSTLSSTPNILDVVDSSSDWWISWREQHFALRKSVGTNSLRDFVQQKLGEDSCIAVAMGLLAIAVALGQLRIGIDDHKFSLPMPASELVNHILAAVDQIVCDSKKYHDDANIILLYMMRAKHHTENNQLRKAWVRIRQAIHCAQAMNFGAASSTDGTIAAEQAEQQRFIASIFEMDQLVSLILGFPRETDVAFTDARAFGVLLDANVTDESLKMRALRRIIAVMAGHINDRNASGEIVDELTESSQETLELAASHMSNGWWHLLEQPLAEAAQCRYESLMVQTWFWIVQSYLHMPYLINPTNTPNGRRFRSLCLQGTRNIIRTFNYLRSEPSVSVYMCNCDDFQGLLAGVNLLVGILQDAASTVQQSPSSEASSYMDDFSNEYVMDIDGDLALIEELKDIFRYRTHEQGGGISKQGLQVLEELTSFIYDDEEQPSTLDQSEQILSGIGIDVNKRQKTIMLPYFGTISIQLTKKIPRRSIPPTYVPHRLPTPPHNANDYFSDPLMYDQMGFLANTNTYTNSNSNSDIWPTDFIPDMGSKYSPQSENSLPYGDQYNLSQLTQNMPPLSWDSWETFMFDQELSQCWNPQLQCVATNDC